MAFDVTKYLGSVERSVASLTRDGKEARAVTLTRRYPTSVDDLWDAITNPERLPRWFLPIEGTLEQGGRYQLVGNAGGTITLCAAPTDLDLTWEFGGGVSWVDVRLSSEGAERTLLKLVHIAPLDEHWGTYGPGASGIGWELGLLGLALHLDDPEKQFDEDAFAATPEGRLIVEGSGLAWGEAEVAFGTERSLAREAARRTIAFYLGEGGAE